MWDTTCWSDIIAAQHQDSLALQKLCQDYWPSIYAFLRFKKFSEEDAQDCTQAFFATLLEKNWIVRANAEKGKFRTFLLTLLTRFIRDEYARQQTAFERSIVLTKEIDVFLEPLEKDTPETHFNRVWARSLFEIAMDRFRYETRDLLEYKVVWLYYFYGCPLLKLGDITRPQTFITQLTTTNCAATKMIIPDLPAHAAQTIFDYTTSYPPRDLLKTIINTINQKIVGPPLYEPHIVKQNETLLPADIKNSKAFIENFSSPKNEIAHYLYSRFSQETLDIVNKSTRTNSPSQLLKKSLITELNNLLQFENFYNNNNFSSIENIAQQIIANYINYPLPYINRLILEAAFSELFEPISQRLNRCFFEQSFADIIPNLYVDQPTYILLAEKLDSYKNKIHMTMKNGIEHFSSILKQEIERYTGIDCITEEIGELLTALHKKG